eukprot:Opistho-2@44819
MPRFPSSAAQTAHPSQVECQTHELELGLDLVQSPQTELPEPQHALDPPVGRLHDPLPLAVGSLAFGCLQLGIHRCAVRVLLGVDLKVLLALATQRHDQLARTVLQSLEHRLRSEPRIGQNLLGVIAQGGLHCRQQYGQAIVVGGVVGELGRHHDLRGLVHRRVRVVAVVIATTCALHDAAVRVGEALLGAVLGNAEVALVAPALGFAVLVPGFALVVLAASARGIGFLLALLQPQLGRRDGGQAIGPALDLAGDVDVGLVLLQIVGRLRSVEQAVNLGFEFGLGLEHALVAHGLVTARIGLELGAVHRHGAQFDQSALTRQANNLNEQG